MLLGLSLQLRGLVLLLLLGLTRAWLLLPELSLLGQRPWHTPVPQYKRGWA